MTRRAIGSIDGIQLSHFELGRIYDVASVLACYLVASGYARPCDSDPQGEPPPLHEQGIDHLRNAPSTRKLLTFGDPDLSRAEAADRPRRRKSPRHRA